MPDRLPPCPVCGKRTHGTPPMPTADLSAVKKSAIECKHGALARNCEVCELQAENARLARNASLPMPKGYGRDWSEIVDAVDLFGPADEHLHVFDYTDPPNLPLALTCAALCANLHAKENADAR